MRQSTGSPCEASGLRWSRRLAGALTICISLPLLSVLVPARPRDVPSRIPRPSTTGASTGSRDLHRGGYDIPLRLTHAASLADQAPTIDAAASPPDRDVAGPGPARNARNRVADAGPVYSAVPELSSAASASLPRGRAPPPPA